MSEELNLETLRNEQLFTYSEVVVYLQREGYTTTEGREIISQVVYAARDSGRLVGTKSSETKQWLFTQEAIDTYAQRYLHRNIDTTPSDTRAQEAQVARNDGQLVGQGGVLMPSCWRCHRIFEAHDQYEVKQVVINNTIEYKPFCSDGYCDPPTLKLLKSLKKQIEQAISDYRE